MPFSVTFVVCGPLNHGNSDQCKGLGGFVYISHCQSSRQILYATSGYMCLQFANVSNRKLQARI